MHIIEKHNSILEYFIKIDKFIKKFLNLHMPSFNPNIKVFQTFSDENETSGITFTVNHLSCREVMFSVVSVHMRESPRSVQTCSPVDLPSPLLTSGGYWSTYSSQARILLDCFPVVLIFRGKEWVKVKVKCTLHNIDFVHHLDFTLESLIKLSYMCTKGDRDVIDSFYIFLRI